MSLLASRAIGNYQTLAIQSRRLAKIFLRTTKGEADVEPLGRQVGAPIFLPCNVAESGQFESVFNAIRATWAGSTP